MSEINADWRHISVGLALVVLFVGLLITRPRQQAAYSEAVPASLNAVAENDDPKAQGAPTQIANQPQ